MRFRLCMETLPLEVGRTSRCGLDHTKHFPARLRDNPTKKKDTGGRVWASSHDRHVPVAGALGAPPRVPFRAPLPKSAVPPGKTPAAQVPHGPRAL
ncbi:hypothetical protein GCM10018987_47250 [Streptomyces cremeus]